MSLFCINLPCLPHPYGQAPRSLELPGHSLDMLLLLLHRKTSRHAVPELLQSDSLPHTHY